MVQRKEIKIKDPHEFAFPSKNNFFILKIAILKSVLQGVGGTIQGIISIDKQGFC